ncbi:MAG: hypothetical protein ABW158_00385, partial [Candidatus Thiodiazotropha sp. 6PDIVS]
MTLNQPDVTDRFSGAMGVLVTTYIFDWGIAFLQKNTLTNVTLNPIKIGFDFTLGFSVAVHKQWAGDRVGSITCCCYAG